VAEEAGDEVLKVGQLEIRPDEFTATAGGVSLSLTVRELELLTALARREGRIVTRQELYAVVWGGGYTRADRSVDVYIAKLRTKLEEALPGWSYIHTHFGFGYRFAPERDLAGDSEAPHGADLSSQLFHDRATHR
jgi:DNA-binding response OmpR family regulator